MDETASDGHVDAQLAERFCNEDAPRGLLSAAPQLEVLKLRNDQPQNLREILGDFTWAHLRKLTLHGFEATENELVGLLTNYASTLERLSMTDFHFPVGSWQGARQRVKSRMTKSCRMKVM